MPPKRRRDFLEEETSSQGSISSRLRSSPPAPKPPAPTLDTRRRIRPTREGTPVPPGADSAEDALVAAARARIEADRAAGREPRAFEVGRRTPSVASSTTTLSSRSTRSQTRSAGVELPSQPPVIPKPKAKPKPKPKPAPAPDTTDEEPPRRKRVPRAQLVSVAMQNTLEDFRKLTDRSDYFRPTVRGIRLPDPRRYVRFALHYAWLRRWEWEQRQGTGTTPPTRFYITIGGRRVNFDTALQDIWRAIDQPNVYAFDDLIMREVFAEGFLERDRWDRDTPNANMTRFLEHNGIQTDMQFMENILREPVDEHGVYTWGFVRRGATTTGGLSDFLSGIGVDNPMHLYLYRTLDAWREYQETNDWILSMDVAIPSYPHTSPYWGEVLPDATSLASGRFVTNPPSEYMQGYGAWIYELLQDTFPDNPKYSREYPPMRIMVLPATDAEGRPTPGITDPMAQLYKDIEGLGAAVQFHAFTGEPAPARTTPLPPPPAAPTAEVLDVTQYGISGATPLTPGVCNACFWRSLMVFEHGTRTTGVDMRQLRAFVNDYWNRVAVLGRRDQWEIRQIIDIDSDWTEYVTRQRNRFFRARGGIENWWVEEFHVHTAARVLNRRFAVNVVGDRGTRLMVVGRPTDPIDVYLHNEGNHFEVYVPEVPDHTARITGFTRPTLRIIGERVPQLTGTTGEIDLHAHHRTHLGAGRVPPVLSDSSTEDEAGDGGAGDHGGDTDHGGGMEEDHPGDAGDAASSLRTISSAPTVPDPIQFQVPVLTPELRAHRYRGRPDLNPRRFAAMVQYYSDTSVRRKFWIKNNAGRTPKLHIPAGPDGEPAETITLLQLYDYYPHVIHLLYQEAIRYRERVDEANKGKRKYQEQLAWMTATLREAILRGGPDLMIQDEGFENNKHVENYEEDAEEEGEEGEEMEEDEEDEDGDDDGGGGDGGDGNPSVASTTPTPEPPPSEWSRRSLTPTRRQRPPGAEAGTNTDALPPPPRPAVATTGTTTDLEDERYNQLNLEFQRVLEENRNAHEEFNRLREHNNQQLEGMRADHALNLRMAEATAREAYHRQLAAQQRELERLHAQLKEREDAFVGSHQIGNAQFQQLNQQIDELQADRVRMAQYNHELEQNLRNAQGWQQRHNELMIAGRELEERLVRGNQQLQQLRARELAQFQQHEEAQRRAILEGEYTGHDAINLRIQLERQRQELRRLRELAQKTELDPRELQRLRELAQITEVSPKPAAPPTPQALPPMGPSPESSLGDVGVLDDEQYASLLPPFRFTPPPRTTPSPKPQAKPSPKRRAQTQPKPPPKRASTPAPSPELNLDDLGDIPFDMYDTPMEPVPAPTPVPSPVPSPTPSRISTPTPSDVTVMSQLTPTPSRSPTPAPTVSSVSSLTVSSITVSSNDSSVLRHIKTEDEEVPLGTQSTNTDDPEEPLNPDDAGVGQPEEFPSSSDDSSSHSSAPQQPPLDPSAHSPPHSESESTTHGSLPDTEMPNWLEAIFGRHEPAAVVPPVVDRRARGFDVAPDILDPRRARHKLFGDFRNALIGTVRPDNRIHRDAGSVVPRRF